MKNSRFPYVLVALLLLALVAGPGFAQRGQPRADAAFQVRLGYFFPDGDSNVWQDNEEIFTLDTSDFDEFVLGFSFVRSLNNHVEVGFNVDLYSDEQLSSDTEFVDELFNPIYHDTNLEMVPLTIDVRFLPAGRYRVRPGGRYVLRPAFYVGFGAGVNIWEYEEVGDFVFTTEDSPGVFVDEILYDRFKDSGETFQAHVLAGFELPMGDSFGLQFEGRYSWAEDDVDDTYLGPGELDLSGPSFYVGGSFRF
ncbi:MAG: outer membrane beta-barrel protein [bacterium]|nr:outer membrane beta-barrel protein [bacterium]